MEEKERFELFGEHCIKDNNPDARCQLLDTYKVCVILNEQDKRIKEMEETNKVLSNELTKNSILKQGYIEACCGIPIFEIPKIKEENQQLKQQLHDLPKKIVEYFYDEIRHRAILEDDYCPDHNLERKYGVRKCLLENIRTTILKKYGGEDESK